MASDNNHKKPLRICIASAEVAPLAKTGGLADVTSALAAQLHRDGHDVRLLMPFYSQIDTSDIDVQPVDFLQSIPMRIGHRHGEFSIDTVTLPGSSLKIYLLRCPELYDRDGIYTQSEEEHLRFILLSRAAIVMCQYMQFAPDIFSCHDWHTALIPLYLKSVYQWDSLFSRTRSVLTIHNIGYQGVFGAGILPDLDLGDAAVQLHQDELRDGRISFMKTGVLHAHLLTTVSPTYAREIQSDEYGMGLQGLLRERSNTLIGILNGVDYDEWDPATDRYLPENYGPGDLSGKKACKISLLKDVGLAAEERRPLIGVVSRLVHQKGIDLMQRVLPGMLGRRDFSLVVLGSGEQRFEDFFRSLQKHFPRRVCYYKGYNNKLAHYIEAGADMFLMPSIYEPCGLNQMYSLKYGTVPIVRETGGLADSVEQINAQSGSGTGILFKNYDETGLIWAINRGLKLFQDRPLWNKVMQNGMAQDFSWKKQADRYVGLFRALGN